MTRDIFNLVLAHINKQELTQLLIQLRTLDNELDQKMEEVRIAQQNVPVIDRINIFTNSDAEQHLKEENKIYQEIRTEHGKVVLQIKELIGGALYQDFSVMLKVQTSEIMRSVAALRVEHKWGLGGKAHEYRIQGISTLRDRIGHLATNIDAQYGFQHEPLNEEELLNLVYDDILRKEGFVE